MRILGLDPGSRATGYGIVEYMFTGGVKKYGVPPTKLPR